MIAKSHQWQLGAVALATLMCLWGTDATALSLGRITVQSALGEPLKAEIDILDINAEEAASLSARVAGPEAFKAAGLDYNAAMTSLQATLQRRSDGRAYIKLSGDRAINDPFVDMILETSWNTGRIVRDYTMLFDPPGLRTSNTAQPTTAQLPAPTGTSGAERSTVPTQSTSKTQTTPREMPPVAPLKPAVAAARTPAVAAPKPAIQQSPQGGSTITVKAGDTAGRIAAANKPASVSLDQMLVALLRANPQAFIQDNVNRIKAGSIVTLPTEEQASATPAAQASQTIIAQSQDFNDFRRKFASSAPAAQIAPTSRDVSGKIQASVDDKKPGVGTPDKLTLSKGSIQGKTGEDQLAQARALKDAASRSAELAKNISDLSKLAAASGAPAAVASPPASAGKTALPIVVAPPPVPITASAPGLPVSAAASAPQVALSASAPASTPVAMASAPKVSASAVPIPSQPVAEPGFIDTLLENPLLPAGAAGLIALLAGFGFYKARQRKKTALQDSSFVESKLRSDSFSGASGGQNVDTSDHLTTGSSMVYSPSQLDAVDDVDPVAEADVYLAYGRDLQAEEILKDALRTAPQRVAIHHKLLEIYAKRRDAKAFEAIAALAFNLTDGTGPEWEQICEKGLSIDPDNALYLPGGQPLAAHSVPTIPAAMEPSLDTFFASMDPEATAVPAPEVDGPLDLDLDFSLEEPLDLPSEIAPPEPKLEIPDFSFNTDELTQPLPTITDDMQSTVIHSIKADLEPMTEPATLVDKLDFSVPTPQAPHVEDDDDMVKTQTLMPESRPELTRPSRDTDLMSFDLSSMSLELEADPVTEPGAFVDETMDPLETKLALADEFRAIGDDDGARALIEEVIAEASGYMKVKAQRALSKL